MGESEGGRRQLSGPKQYVDTGNSNFLNNFIRGAEGMENCGVGNSGSSLNVTTFSPALTPLSSGDGMVEERKQELPVELNWFIQIRSHY